MSYPRCECGCDICWAKQIDGAERDRLAARVAKLEAEQDQLVRERCEAKSDFFDTAVIASELQKEVARLQDRYARMNSAREAAETRELVALAECDELRAALTEAVALAEESVGQLDEYWRNSWDLDQRLARVKAALADKST